MIFFALNIIYLFFANTFSTFGSWVDVQHFVVLSYYSIPEVPDRPKKLEISECDGSEVLITL